MSQTDWKSRLGVVFSTNPDFSYESSDEESIHSETPAPGKQRLIVSIDKRHRAGKQVPHADTGGAPGNVPGARKARRPGGCGFRGKSGCLLPAKV